MSYEVIIFDADNTLFDFTMSERRALKQTMETFQINYSEEDHLPIYVDINKEIWQEFEKGLITQKALKGERFRRLGEKLGVDIEPQAFSSQYLEHLSYASILYNETLTLIKRLKENYRLSILTNGLTSVQNRRVRQSELAPYLEDVVISEEINLSKPDPAIFKHALERLNVTDKSKVLMVGDSLSSDIQGGINAGIDTCWFNPKHHPNTTSIHPKYEINSLTKLLDLLEAKV